MSKKQSNPRPGPDVVKPPPPTGPPKKGMKNGDCNRSVCMNKNAEYYNYSTYKYYCASCAVLINDENRADLSGNELCVKSPLLTDT